MSPVSTNSSRAIYDALKAAGLRLLSALPETWLVHLVRMVEQDPEMTLGPACQRRRRREEHEMTRLDALLTTLVAKVDAVGPAGYVTGLSLLENRFQVSRSLRS